jgi:hypothetical protein
MKMVRSFYVSFGHLYDVAFAENSKNAGLNPARYRTCRHGLFQWDANHLDSSRLRRRECQRENSRKHVQVLMKIDMRWENSGFKYPGNLSLNLGTYLGRAKPASEERPQESAICSGEHTIPIHQAAQVRRRSDTPFTNK